MRAADVDDGTQMLIHQMDHPGHLAGVNVRGDVADCHEAAGRQGGDQPADSMLCLPQVRDVMQDGQEHQGGWLGEVQDDCGLVQDRVGVPQVGVDVAGDTLVPAGQQGPGVRQYQRVMVDVHDPA
jgi:hypothetical protein